MEYENIYEKYGCSIENFIKDEYSVCREERQYAVFLYNILRKYNTPEKRKEDPRIGTIFRNCYIPPEAEIRSVFYEATFMRDFFERNRRVELGLKMEKNLEEQLLRRKPSFSRNHYLDKGSFNEKLIQYAADTDQLTYMGKENNLGRNPVECDKLAGEELSPEKISEIKRIIPYMMNVKPDIAVVYQEDQKESGPDMLLFLECKFESEESSYKNGNGQKISQRTIQWMAAEFLCRWLREEHQENIKVSVAMKQEKKSCLVQFVREIIQNRIQNKIQKKPERQIWIADLIAINNKIFL